MRICLSVILVLDDEYNAADASLNQIVYCAAALSRLRDASAKRTRRAWSLQCNRKKHAGCQAAAGGSSDPLAKRGSLRAKPSIISLVLHRFPWRTLCKKVCSNITPFVSNSSAPFQITWGNFLKNNNFSYCLARTLTGDLQGFRPLKTLWQSGCVKCEPIDKK